MVQERGLKLARDLILFALGVAGMVHETVVASEPRLIVICACFGMMGVPLPQILKQDAAAKQEEKGP